MEVKPYSESSDSKKTQVAMMFNNIAHRYDFLNHLLSMGVDKIWRRRAIRLLKDLKSPRVLDIATGTGDLAIVALRLKPSEVVGLDLSKEMLKVAQVKINRKGVADIIKLMAGDSENLPFEDNSFDAITVAFGVRNFENLNKGLSEMSRVLKPGGKVVVLEFSNPDKFPIKQIYGFYFKYVLPFWGGLFSKDKAAYTYLPESVKAFPEGENFENEMKRANIKPIKRFKQTFGVATIYFGEKASQ
ncbi:MAG: bifunctional demethylmenaquinone methyltransferase/2-methoxy-6-polyprenyl-1,4-benzoquinol methylase UbiE [Breznakibacter sp.]|nr:bifunctional demethylmenaquinone methyltransferase/2-methoxy-6-polyprenyl-1,4-benzoquinol methylase UbiE [Breznakibacter sp.]